MKQYDHSKYDWMNNSDQLTDDDIIKFVEKLMWYHQKRYNKPDRLNIGILPENIGLVDRFRYDKIRECVQNKEKIPMVELFCYEDRRRFINKLIYVVLSECYFDFKGDNSHYQNRENLIKRISNSVMRD